MKGIKEEEKRIKEEEKKEKVILDVAIDEQIVQLQELKRRCQTKLLRTKLKWEIESRELQNKLQFYDQSIDWLRDKTK